MKTIGDTIARDLSKPIEEIIKVDQADEETVYRELTEYVSTGTLRSSYHRLLKAIAEYRQDLHEGVGVWVSGFFGSGKSSFAKNLGYALGARKVLGQSAVDLLKKQLEDQACGDLLDLITARERYEVVMFDVQTDKASGGSGNVSISYYLYRALLRDLDYAEDFDIAELEQTLEVDDDLKEFIETFEAHHKAAFEKAGKREQVAAGHWRWSHRRKLAMKMNEASMILSRMWPAKFPETDTWAKSQATKRIEVTPAVLVEKTFELMRRRRKGKGLVFIVDEVGAFVSRSAEKIEDLRAVVEQLGKASKNKLKAKQADGPVWVVVTSQEKLDDVVAAIDSKRVELVRLLERFKIPIDLPPKDIREVATKRVLSKKSEAVAPLIKLYGDHEGLLNKNLQLERSQRRTNVTEQDFVEFYPYPPHFIDMSIDIMAGIRLQPGAPRHLGGSNRTIIKQAYEMLASSNTNLRAASFGRLVTLDLVFDLVVANLASEKQKDVSDIAAQFGATSWECRVAKVLTLLEFIRDLPRTEVNVAAMLCERVDVPAPLAPVKQALQKLEQAQFVRQTAEGFKLQTQSEKGWSTQRQALDPKPRERSEILRETLGEVFSEPKLRQYTFKGLKRFKVGLSLDGTSIEDGQLALDLISADSAAQLAKTVQDTQAATRQKVNEDRVYWAFPLSPDVDDLVAEVFRSRSMIAKYEQLRGQGKITPDESSCLANERTEAIRFGRLLREGLVKAVESGTGLFQGVSYDNAALGKGLGEIVKELLGRSVPKIYGNFDIGAIPLGSFEPAEILKAANLGGLPQPFYDPAFALVTNAGGKSAPNVDAPACKEVLNFLKSKSEFGERVDGKELERKFMGPGYGWDVEVIRTLMALLLRAGAVEMTHQDRKYRSGQDPGARAPFTSAVAFRNAVFAPRGSISIKLLTAAGSHLEAITGQEVNAEETAIFDAFKKYADEEEKALLPIIASAGAYQLAQAAPLSSHLNSLRAIRDSASDDCVRALANEGKSLAVASAKATTLRNALTAGGLEVLKRAKGVLGQLARALPAEAAEGVAAAAELKDLVDLAEDNLKLKKVAELVDAVEASYDKAYTAAHAKRSEALAVLLDRLRGRGDWPAKKEDAEPIEKLIISRGIHDSNREAYSSTCSVCRASLPQLGSDLAGVGSLESEAIQRLVALTTPPEVPVKRVAVRSLCNEALDSRESVRQFIEVLEGELLKLIDEGARIIVE